MATWENGQSVALGFFYSASRLGRMLLSSVEDYASLAGFFSFFGGDRWWCKGKGSVAGTILADLHSISFSYALAHRGLQLSVSTGIKLGSWTAFWSMGCLEMISYFLKNALALLFSFPLLQQLCKLYIRMVASQVRGSWSLEGRIIPMTLLAWRDFTETWVQQEEVTYPD